VKKSAIAVCFLLFLFLSVGTANALRPGYIYDRAGTLTSEEVSLINNFCRQVESQSTAEIVVVTLPDLSDYDGDMSVARETIFNDEALDGLVGIGKADSDNGVLIVISIDEREWGVEVGYGLEGNLTDGESGRIGRDIMVPYLKAEDYYSALMSGANAVANEIYGYSTFPTDGGVGEPEFDLDFWIMLGVIVFVVILGLIIRSRGGYGGSGYGYGRYGGGGGGGSGGGGSSGGW
jgi:uncharacterized protein